MAYNNELVQQMRANGLPLSAEGNEELYPAVVAGDPIAIKKMIEGNMSLVINKVDAYVRQYPSVAHLSDDLISEGFVGLTSSVQRMAKGSSPENANPTGYMSYWIGHAIGAVIDKESGVGASVRTMKRKRANGEDVVAQVPGETHSVPDVIADPMSMVDLREMLDACCETEEDRIILRMREQGYVDREIAAAIDAPVTTTYMRRRELYARFLEKSGLQGEV